MSLETKVSNQLLTYELPYEENEKKSKQKLGKQRTEMRREPKAFTGLSLPGRLAKFSR